MERLSKLISKHATNMTMSRREAERLIHQGEVTVAGKQVSSPHLLLSWKDAQSSIRVSGKHAHIVAEENSSSSSLSSGTKVWLVHKLAGEVVSDQDPHGRPSMLARLAKGGVGKRGKKQKDHLKAIGRLDMSTEGLILVTNDGHYKRQLELPSNVVHRVYRVRVHGKLTPYKLKMMRSGVTIDGIHYNGMKVQLETTSTTTRQQQQSSSRSNTWLRVTCTEGKNRQIRKVFEHFGRKCVCVCAVSYLLFPVRLYSLSLSLSHSFLFVGLFLFSHTRPHTVVKKNCSECNEIDSYILW